MRVEQRRRPHRAPRATPAGSRFAVGSSSSTRPGRIASTPASASRCFCPPESALVGRSSGTSSPTASSASRTRGQISSRGHAEVLAAERDVVADPGEDHLRVGVLQHEPGAARAPGGRHAVDEQRAGLLALVVAAEHAGEAVQQRRLARPRRAEQQHALPGLDAERGVPHRPRAAATRAASPTRAPRRRRGGRRRPRRSR